MTNTTWLAMATMAVTSISTISAPLLAIWLTPRLSQPKAIPDTNIPAKRSQSKEPLFKRLLTSIWFGPGWVICFNGLFLIRNILRANPLTTLKVVEICFDVSWMIFGICLFFILSLLKMTSLLQQVDQILRDSIVDLGRTTAQISRINQEKIANLESKLFSKSPKKPRRH
jgi:hypothetical protein